MEGKIPDEPSTDYARIPLIELPVSEEPKPASEGDPAEDGEGRPDMFCVVLLHKYILPTRLTALGDHIASSCSNITRLCAQRGH